MESWLTFNYLKSHNLLFIHKPNLQRRFSTHNTRSCKMFVCPNQWHRCPPEETPFTNFRATRPLFGTGHERKKTLPLSGWRYNKQKIGLRHVRCVCLAKRVILNLFFFLGSSVTERHCLDQVPVVEDPNPWWRNCNVDERSVFQS